MIFTGTFVCTLDKFTRITLPKEFRLGLPAHGSRLFVRPADNYLIVTTEQFLMEYIQRMAAQNPANEISRETQRMFFMPMKTVHVDPQGRLKLKQTGDFKEGEELVLIGMGKDFEIWRKAELSARHPEWDEM